MKRSQVIFVWPLAIQQCCYKAPQSFLLYDSCVSSQIWPSQILHGWDGWLYLEGPGYIEVASDLTAYNCLHQLRQCVVNCCASVYLLA